MRPCVLAMHSRNLECNEMSFNLILQCVNSNRTRGSMLEAVHHFAQAVVGVDTEPHVMPNVFHVHVVKKGPNHWIYAQRFTGCAFEVRITFAFLAKHFLGRTTLATMKVRPNNATAPIMQSRLSDPMFGHQIQERRNFFVENPSHQVYMHPIVAHMRDRLEMGPHLLIKQHPIRLVIPPQAYLKFGKGLLCAMTRLCSQVVYNLPD